MLSLLKIKNIALIDELQLEFAAGLNLLTGETGSGKSIIVDSLGALTGERISSELIKEGENSAQIEGLFLVNPTPELFEIFTESGIELEEAEEIDLIIRRELSVAGRNRIFVNNQLVTQSLLKKIGVFLVDIHGQGEQATLFNASTHLEILDEYAKLKDLRGDLAAKYRHWSNIQTQLGMLRQNEAEKLQLLDILRFQVEEIRKVDLLAGEDEALEEEKKRLNNVEKLSNLSEESYALLYENETATVSTLEKVVRRINELAEYESSFAEYDEGLAAAQAHLEDLAITLRDFRNRLEFSPERLGEIENRLAEISRLKRKYGGSIESILSYLADSEDRLNNIETAELREEQLNKELTAARKDYLLLARKLHEKRIGAAKQFEKEVESNLKAVALERAKFEAKFTSDETDDKSFTNKGFDKMEFYFSANLGESVKPIGKVASGGELSRLMLILNTTTKLTEHKKAMVFDEIDTGIGGRVAEAVGFKLKELAQTQQVLCVTHQPQVAALGDHHYVVQKSIVKDRTQIQVVKLTETEVVEEVARMLAGEKITEAARQHAQEMIQNSKSKV